jgi:hypothetical protein
MFYLQQNSEDNRWSTDRILATKALDRLAGIVRAPANRIEMRMLVVTTEEGVPSDYAVI